MEVRHGLRSTKLPNKIAQTATSSHMLERQQERHCYVCDTGHFFLIS